MTSYLLSFRIQKLKKIRNHSEYRYYVSRRTLPTTAVIFGLLLTFYGAYYYFKKQSVINVPLEISTSGIYPPFEQINPERIKEAARMIQSSLLNLQKPPNCNVSKVLHCKHFSVCGFGCQIHYRMMCAILSNLLQVPILHSIPSRWWPYTQEWNTFLKPIGTSCPIGKNTTYINWGYHGELAIARILGNGLPIPLQLYQMLNGIFPSANSKLFWLLGQYLKFVFQLNSNAATQISGWREKLNITSNKSEMNRNPLIGIHVRRTDKIQETKEIRGLEDFEKAAKKYRDELIKRNVKFDRIDVFVASDDPNVLSELQKKFDSKRWNIVGFPPPRTFTDSSKSQLFAILRDITILSECDFVICTYSSNICRLILEMQVNRDSENGIVHPDPERRIASLEGGFYIATYSSSQMPWDVVTFNTTPSVPVSKKKWFQPWKPYYKIV